MNTERIVRESGLSGFAAHHFRQALVAEDAESFAFHERELARRLERAVQRVHFARYVSGLSCDDDKALAYIGMTPAEMATEVARVKSERAFA